ncbi:TPA: hypothetical protein DEW47_02985 [Patescibacteria group bacterium]|nr:MAG: polymerase beta domain protein region protein [Parcubacteria group bacterium GW2011_GWF2_40_10]KKR47780.1 MAG: polymerase beta domain protein region protein [Parcubacteria group bacterium GW2011_GWA2_40_143]KKR60114.1 MAG: polymerase beta domain protein region protein [Parcubacteria group bacterium GW2011_GWC2_40_31]HBB56476.1 hypothetical protein [Patescibacteria group bacterium]HCI04917.1 hypothetical protein [Patescibacteria group bacterium]
MSKVIISQKTKEKLEALGVGILYLFGSRSRGVALEKSDYDIGVVFINTKRDDTMKRHGIVYDILNDIFPDAIDGPKLDISYLQEANASLQMSAIQYGKAIFEINPRFRADYEESVLKRYDDYRFLQKEYENATFAAFQK